MSKPQTAESTTNGLSHQTTFGPNAAGQVVSVTDPLSKVTGFTYAGGDLVSVETPLGHTLTRLTDAAGRLISVTDPLGARTGFEYNAHNQITKIVDPLGGETTFTFLGARGAPPPLAAARLATLARRGRRRSMGTATC